MNKAKNVIVSYQPKLMKKCEHLGCQDIAEFLVKEEILPKKFRQKGFCCQKHIDYFVKEES